MRKELSPVNPTVRKLGFTRTPLGMRAIALTHEQDAAMQRVALDIFTDCVNGGVCFADALAAIYLSGLRHGSQAGCQ